MANWQAVGIILALILTGAGGFLAGFFAGAESAMPPSARQGEDKR